MISLICDAQPDQQFASFVRSLPLDATVSCAWRNYKPLVAEIIREFKCSNICEIGGGRLPLLTRQEIDHFDVRYTVNDIARSELDRAPEWLHKACFDIAGTEVPSENRDRYDLVISKMVMEHVSDAQRAYENIFALLRAGGIFLNFHPVLFAIPFIFNWLLPEGSSRRLLRLFKPDRHDDGIPKFPARYSHCVIRDRTLEMIKEIGFSNVTLIAFYGHGYFERLPVIRQIDDYLNDWAMRKEHRLLASYCYALGRK